MADEIEKVALSFHPEKAPGPISSQEKEEAFPAYLLNRDINTPNTTQSSTQGSKEKEPNKLTSSVSLGTTLKGEKRKEPLSNRTFHLLKSRMNT